MVAEHGVGSRGHHRFRDVEWLLRGNVGVFAPAVIAHEHDVVCGARTAYFGREPREIGPGDASVRRVSREITGIPDVRDGEERDGPAVHREHRRPILFAGPARGARVANARALEREQGVEKSTLAVVPDVIVREADDVKGRTRHERGAARRSHEREGSIRALGLAVLVAERRLEIRERNMRAGEERSQVRERIEARVAKNALADVASEVHVAGSEDDQGRTDGRRSVAGSGGRRISGWSGR